MRENGSKCAKVIWAYGENGRKVIGKNNIMTLLLEVEIDRENAGWMEFERW